MLLVADEMCSDMILDDFGHQTGYRPSRTGDEVHHLLATSLAIECALNCVDLTPGCGGCAPAAFAFRGPCVSCGHLA